MTWTNFIKMHNEKMHILPNNSRSKGNQIIKFDQLLEYNVRNTFI